MKETLIDLIKKADLDHPIASVALEFLESYDGTNEDELKKFFVLFIMVMHEQELLRVKATSYDKVEEAKDTADTQIAQIQHDLQQLDQGTIPMPPIEDTAE